MIVKIHKTNDGRKIIAVCDDNLLGKKFEEKKLQLDLTSNFYKGDKKSEKEVLDLIKGAYIVNFVGEKSIRIGIMAGIINKGGVIRIKNIPHSQAIVL
ncbi:DUF424 family protein [Candidatus Woesearchaeota archaeon]|nr:DUF424 family protein [Candidatus Woesearchaeota archaeon]